MPLLKRKAFEKSKESEYLRDDDEVFHCEITDEIFKDYEEYCERIILVNSMVWSCEMTGKNNLTYAEALESEKAARKSLKDFPMELRIPILYLAALTKRTSFAEMTEDVFNFVRERYFVGETVEAVLEGDSWVESHILTVTAPKQEPGNKTILPASEYCYEVEQLDDDNNQSGTVSHDRVRRRKGIFSREKCRLFMKQFVEMAQGGIIGIKKQALEKYNISKVSFDQIFTGTPPEFPSSKKLVKLSVTPNKTPGKSTPKPGSAKSSAKKPTPNSKKGKQQSMDMFVNKVEKGDKEKNESNQNKQKVTAEQSKKLNQELVDKMRRAEEAMRQLKEEEKARENDKKARLKAYIKEWQKVKEDLLLEDHKVIPKATPIYMEGIPHEHFGDFLSVLEFIHLYSETLKTKDVFHSGLDLETFRKALTQKEHAGVFSDIVQMMMTTLFSLQEDEAEEYNEGGRIAEATEDGDTNISGELGVTKAVEYATKACKWSQTYLGTPLSKLPLDPTTVSEVLRLHILSSGAEGGSRCATWRYQQRGGYSSIDDAGLHLRVARPDLVRRLHQHHVADLHLDDKLRVLQCLMNQILSYATVRDIIEEKIESCKNTKIELRALLQQERKREVELVAQRTKLRKEAIAKKEEGKLKGEEAAAVDNQLTAQLEKLNKESEAKKAAFQKKQQQLQADCFQHLSYLGSDRAYRRYWVHKAVGGVLVETGAETRGPCVSLVLPRDLGQGDTLAYVTQLFERGHEPGGSDKENDSASNSRGNSPKKPFAPLNGLSVKLNGMDSNMQHMKELFVCTGDVDSCYVHGSVNRPDWSFYHTEEQIESLIQSLNKRGVRESELRQILETDKANFMDNVSKCPVYMLNPAVAPPPPVVGTRHRKYSPSLSVPANSTVSEALELSLRDYILELEEKIFHGCLGAISIKDREAWRGTLMLRGYDKQADYLTWGPNKQYRDDRNHVNGDVKHDSNDPENPEVKPTIPEYKYRDPGFYLGEVHVKTENGLHQTDPEVVKGLASALLQVEQGIHHKYIRRPLGLDEKERKERDSKGKPLDLDALERWEVSLMESKSYSQIFVHLFTLDSSVMWSASILNASCRICRRKTDPDNMLLCDTCNKGHHLYCLKPKLTKVPAGDWFCDQCKPKEPPTPRKRRKLFSDEEIEETLQDSGDEDIHTGVCVTCGSGGILACMCQVCESRFHRECARPAPPRAARRWTCASCLNPTKKHTVRRCAAEAMNNIHQYANSLNETFADTSDSDDSEDNQALVKLKSRKVKLKVKMARDSIDSPTVNGDSESHSKRSRKSKEEQNTSTSSRKSRTPGAKIKIINGHHEESKSSSKRSSRHVEKLHFDAVEELLKDVMRHKDCWPFYDPVNIEEVPDYLDVIDTPMDFTTIRSKLTDRRYESDEQVIQDATLVFTNCYVYNQESHLVAKAGVRLEKFFNKRCAELDLPQLPEINLENGEVVLQLEPKAKKAKLK